MGGFKLCKGILQSIKQKNVLYRKFIRSNNLTKRELLLQNFKQKFTKTQFANSQELINQITTSAILKNTKTTLKKTCDGIRFIISLKTNSH